MEWEMQRSVARIGAVVLCMFIATAVNAASLTASFTGNLATDDQHQLFNFTVGGISSQDVTLRSWSYAGGTNAAGQVIPAGGFDPILAVFDSIGTLIDQNDDGGCGLVAADPRTGRCWDSFLNLLLAPGNYTVSISEYNNFANGPTLADGFLQDGQ